uniref:Guanine nucleotide-binding protein-like 3 homolog n=1 Tax=Plectus sambesii TaxID=2011161 RepID=A0A914XAX7_9BILA
MSQLDPVEVALKNAIRVETLQDPISPVQAILRRCARDTLMLQYNIGEFNDCQEFLALVARKLGRLRKGARPDLNAAAKQVLNDWNGGKLRYYTEPPEETTETPAAATLVNEFAKEFDLDALDEDQSLVVNDLPELAALDCVLYSGPETGADAEMSDLSNAQNGKDKRTVVTGKAEQKTKSGPNEPSQTSDQLLTMDIDGNSQVNRLIKKAIKKGKRQQKKHVKRTDSLTKSLETAMDFGSTGDAYDFEQMK